MATYPLTTSHEVRRFILKAVNNANNNLPTEISSLVDSNARIVLDEMWRLLNSSALPTTGNGASPFAVYRTTLRKLTLKLALKHDMMPASLILTGVTRIDDEQHGGGSFADVFCGTYQRRKVALKKLRVYVMTPQSQKEELKKAFYRESLLWKNLLHKNIVPFLGVSEDVFKGTLCMVLLWCESGSLRDHLASIREEGVMSDDDLATAIDKWLHQTTLGLQYLHEEGIIHGDLHAGNILLNECGNACLTDFGMSLIAGGTGYNYGSVHGGGAMRWQAPELIDPEVFGLEGTRPTTQSDVFSIACTAIQLYSGKPPFSGSDLTDVQVSNRYIKGERPSRPCLPGGQAMADQLWSVIRACWTQKRMDRIPVHEVVVRLAAIVRASSMEQLTASMSAVDIQDVDCSLNDVAAAYDGGKWNLQRVKNRAAEHWSDFSLFHADPDSDLILRKGSAFMAKLVVTHLRQLAGYWEDLENCKFVTDAHWHADSSRVTGFIWKWAYQIVHDTMHITEPRNESHVDLDILVRKAFVRAEDEIALFASRCPGGGRWVPTGREYRCDCCWFGPDKITTDGLNEVAKGLTNCNPRIVAAATKLGTHLIRALALARCMITATPNLTSMTDDQSIEVLGFDSIMAAASLIVMLVKHVNEAANANEEFAFVRGGIGRDEYRQGGDFEQRYDHHNQLYHIFVRKRRVEGAEADEEKSNKQPAAGPANDLNLFDMFNDRVRPLSSYYLIGIGKLLAQQEETR